MIGAVEFETDGGVELVLNLRVLEIWSCIAAPCARAEGPMTPPKPRTFINCVPRARDAIQRDQLAPLTYLVAGTPAEVMMKLLDAEDAFNRVLVRNEGIIPEAPSGPAGKMLSLPTTRSVRPEVVIEDDPDDDAGDLW